MGSKNIECTLCRYGLILLGDAPNACGFCPNPTYFHPFTLKCETSCPNGYYKNEMSRACEVCHSTCLSCMGELNVHCLSCYTGMYLLQG